MARWFWWQVLAPLVVPIVLACGVCWLWSQGPTGFQPDYVSLLKVSPWGLTTYAFTLLAITYDRFVRQAERGKVGLQWMFIIIALMVFGLTAFLVVWAQDPSFQQHGGLERSQGVYVVTLVLTAVSIVACWIAGVVTGKWE